MTESSSIGTSLLRGLREAPLSQEPFAHKLIEETLEPGIFDLLRRTFPNPENLNLKLEERQDKRYSDRRLTLPLDRWAELAPAEAREAWRSVAELFCGERLARALHAVFGPAFLKELEANYGTRQFSYRMRSEIVYDRSGFELLPHTDSAAKAATVLTYFASDDDPEYLGTVLFAAKDPAISDPGGRRFIPFDHFELAKQVPFRPNLSVAFPRSDRSFHGVHAADVVRPRRLIQTSLVVRKLDASGPAGR